MVSTFFIFQTLIIKSDRIFSLEDMRITKIKCMARTLFETYINHFTQVGLKKLHGRNFRTARFSLSRTDKNDQIFMLCFRLILTAQRGS